ncbi:MAG: hypothetical protein GX490_04305 [Bacilli bacterium]|nr:hypothetical protein [Bacilli bacterium]
MRRYFTPEFKLLLQGICALFLGILFGNFLGRSMLRNDAIYANAINYHDDVYILQAAHYYDEAQANAFLNKLNELGLQGLVVREYSSFFVYLGISTNPYYFEKETDILTQNGYDYLIKTRKLYYYLNDLDSDSSEYTFYYMSINYYLSLLKNKPVIFTDDYLELVDVVKMDLFNSLQILNAELTSNNTMIYKLLVYQNIVNLLL